MTKKKLSKKRHKDKPKKLEVYLIKSSTISKRNKKIMKKKKSS